MRFTLARVRKGCGSFKARTAIGVDGVPFTLLAGQPDHVLQELSDILLDMVLRLALFAFCNRAWGYADMWGGGRASHTESPSA